MTELTLKRIASDDTMHLEALQHLPFAALQGYVDLIASLGWHRDFPTLEAAWAGCARPNQLIWWLARTADRRQLALCVADLAQPALQPASDPRPAACLEVLRRWARDEATTDELRASADAADRAGRAGRADKAGFNAACAAVSAADVASAADCDAADYAAQDVASASIAAAAATQGEAADRADRVAEAKRAQCALIRRHFPMPPMPALR